jgi:hypothetical protein
MAVIGGFAVCFLIVAYTVVQRPESVDWKFAKWTAISFTAVLACWSGMRIPGIVVSLRRARQKVS